MSADYPNGKLRPSGRGAVTRPLRIKPSEIKDGKIKLEPRKPRSVSEAIRQKRSKRVRVVKSRGP